MKAHSTHGLSVLRGGLFCRPAGCMPLRPPLRSAKSALVVEGRAEGRPSLGPNKAGAVSCRTWPDWNPQKLECTSPRCDVGGRVLA
eukprot:3581622-Pyramimonas_sp.AAC.1